MSTPFVLTQSATVGTNGQISFSFPPPPSGSVYSGNLVVLAQGTPVGPEAFAVTQWMADVGGVPVGTWTGSLPFGPVSAQANQGLVISLAPQFSFTSQLVSLLTPGDQAVAIWRGSVIPDRAFLGNAPAALNSIPVPLQTTSQPVPAFGTISLDISSQGEVDIHRSVGPAHYMTLYTADFASTSYNGAYLILEDIFFERVGLLGSPYNYGISVDHIVWPLGIVLSTDPTTGDATLRVVQSGYGGSPTGTIVITYGIIPKSILSGL